MAAPATRRRARARALARIDGFAPIAAYAAIGDGRTVALVARDGSIDWLPLPAIDGGAVFAAILDAAKGGRFSLAPEGDCSVQRRYLPRTNVLETTFSTESGTLKVTDALNLREGRLLPWVELVRRLECTGGSVRVRWEVEPAFEYGLAETRVERLGDAVVALSSDLRLGVFAWGVGTVQHSSSTAGGVADLDEGDDGLLACVVTDGGPMPHPERDEVEARLKVTAACWKHRTAGRDHGGPWRREVERSALALDLLTSARSGALAAAATTALPERVGGERNFDYRFCWIRDTSFALDALSRLGDREQVHASLSWLLAATEPTHPRIQPLYALDGSVPRSQDDLPLSGYRGSTPVRRGNGAATQIQLGSYGDLFETVWHYVDHGNVLDPTTGTRLAEVADRVCDIWRNEDSGLWELGEHRHYTISKIGCWLALTRAAQLARAGQIPSGGLERWEESREEVQTFVETRCWSDAERSYRFYADDDALDCAVLLAARFGYGDPKGERMNGTIDALLREQRATGPLLYRYTGVQREEGAFLACSFWMVSALAKAGRVGEARDLMDELLPLANDVGLWSEEIDPESRELLGNFPQALTHLSLISAAAAVADAEGEEHS